MKITAIAALIVLSAAAAIPAAAKTTPAPAASPDSGLFPGGSSKEPISIEADRLDYSDRDAKAIYTGNVVLIQGPTKLTCSIMTLFIDKGPQASAAGAAPSPAPAPAAPAGPASSTSQVKHMDCTGPVTIVSKTQTATGDNAIYDKPKNKVWLNGHVTLSDGANVTRGDTLTYDLLTGKAIVETKGPGGGKGRVQSEFVPNSDSSSPASPAKP